MHVWHKKIQQCHGKFSEYTFDISYYKAIALLLIRKSFEKITLMSGNLTLTKDPGQLVAGFLVTKKFTPGTKKPSIKKPGIKYEYVQSIATHYLGDGCVGIKAKYNVQQIYTWDIFLIHKMANVSLFEVAKPSEKVLNNAILALPWFLQHHSRPSH